MVVRTVRLAIHADNANKWFGGLQIIAVGDFYQLPPVPNPLYGDRGAFVFESPIWTSCITHHLNLNIVYRQDEVALINAIQETARGCVSKDTETFLRELGSTPKNLTNPVRLFATNFEKEQCNAIQIQQLGQPITIYAGQDTGSEKYLKKITAPKQLACVIGCPVVVLMNINSQIVNGLRGVILHHNDIGKAHEFKKELFTVYSPKRKDNRATRLQFPLALAYGLTIHKSQGMTLDEVEVIYRIVQERGWVND